MAYRIDYSSATEEHMRWLTARQQRIVLNAVDEQLTCQPTVRTKNRKPMRPNELATWELRIDNLRVYYDVQESPDQVVQVLAVGIKNRNQIRIGGKVAEL